MTKKEILKKDWQLLTAYGTITQIAYLKTIMDNQAVIISELKKIPLKSVVKKMNQFHKKDYKQIVEKVKNNIPNYPAIERTY